MKTVMTKTEDGLHYDGITGTMYPYKRMADGSAVATGNSTLGTFSIPESQALDSGEVFCLRFEGLMGQRVDLDIFTDQALALAMEILKACQANTKVFQDEQATHRSRAENAVQALRWAAEEVA